MFLTLEGGDGAGKSTLMKHLRGLFEGMGREVVTTREPGGCKLGELIREWILQPHSEFPLSAESETLLFLAARAQHLHEVIKPALKEGKVVLCDRFHDSTIAYQGYGRNLGPERIEQLCALACDITPDVTLYLDLSPEQGMARAAFVSPDGDRFEGEELDFHHRVRHGFQQLALKYPNRIAQLDATQSPKQVADAAWDAIQTRL